MRPRPWIYVGCAVLALAVSFALGKDMTWDTLDYHLYAGFSALHDRFGPDYFAAGVQSYFNPYLYVPFYLLATSRLSALAAASILAVLQSGILWLTYETALLAAPETDCRSRVAAGICATLLALGNPILINLLGASSVDVITAELVLAGWLLLLRAVRSPGGHEVGFAGLLLGAVSALKLTNSVHALSAGAVLLLVPVGWRGKLRHAVCFGVAMAAGFVLVALPWSLRLEQHFGNPLFPLLNGVFRSPHFSLARMQDQRFVPDSLRDALWRPFAIAAPVKMVDDEYAAPDVRYALLVALAGMAALLWCRRRFRPREEPAAAPGGVSSFRVLAALACGFLVDWMIWLTISGNGRYFIPMACIAGILVVASIFSLFGDRPSVRNGLLALVILAQALEAWGGATYRGLRQWDGGPWFEVSIPRELMLRPALYFAFGEQSSSYLAAFLPRRSGFINIDGDYVLGSGGANGARVRELIREYSPELRALFPGDSAGGRYFARSADILHVNDTLQRFGLRADTGGCSAIRVRDVNEPWKSVLRGGSRANPGAAGYRIVRVAEPTSEYLIVCPVAASGAPDPVLIAGERQADVVFDRLERGCPALFQPAGTVTLDYGDRRQGYEWVRRYESTDLSVVIMSGTVRFIDPVRGGPAIYLGREKDWESTSLPLVCGRRHGRYFAAIATHAPAGKIVTKHTM